MTQLRHCARLLRMKTKSIYVIEAQRLTSYASIYSCLNCFNKGDSTMSIKVCPDCGNDVSSSAYHCVSCGRPLKTPFIVHIAQIFIAAYSGFMLLSIQDAIDRGDSITTSTASGAIVACVVAIGLLRK